jgi:hypothetical protein
VDDPSRSKRNRVVAFMMSVVFSLSWRLDLSSYFCVGLVVRTHTRKTMVQIQSLAPLVPHTLTADLVIIEHLFPKGKALSLGLDPLCCL